MNFKDGVKVTWTVHAKYTVHDVLRKQHGEGGVIDTAQNSDLGFTKTP